MHRIFLAIQPPGNEEENQEALCDLDKSGEVAGPELFDHEPDEWSGLSPDSGPYSLLDNSDEEIDGQNFVYDGYQLAAPMPSHNQSSLSLSTAPIDYKELEAVRKRVRAHKNRYFEKNLN